MNDTRPGFILARFTYGLVAVMFFISAVASAPSLSSDGPNDSGQHFTAFASTIVCAVLSYFAARRWKHWTKLSAIRRTKPSEDIILP